MKHNTNLTVKPHQSKTGFTFVEMLVAVALSSVCLGAGALAFQSITANAKRSTSIIEIDIGQTTNQSFYPDAPATGKIRTYSAPNFGKLMFAQELRGKFIEDASRSTAVFCLPRSIPNTIRPTTLSYPGGSAYRPKLDTPEAFRAFLAVVETTSTGVYDSMVRNVPDPNKPSTTVYMLGPASSVDEIQVNAIYEVDFVTPSNVSGTYASVRRYVGSSLTHYYDVFYPAGDGTFSYTPFVEFESRSRKQGAEITAEEAYRRSFQIAPYSPFYMVWLPDPSINPYDKQTYTSLDLPRSTYEHMTNKSAFSLVLPMFPSL